MGRGSALPIPQARGMKRKRDVGLTSILDRQMFELLLPAIIELGQKSCPRCNNPEESTMQQKVWGGLLSGFIILWAG